RSRRRRVGIEHAETAVGVEARQLAMHAAHPGFDLDGDDLRREHPRPRRPADHQLDRRAEELEAAAVLAGRHEALVVTGVTDCVLSWGMTELVPPPSSSEPSGTATDDEAVEAVAAARVFGASAESAPADIFSPSPAAIAIASAT